jgi:hypothetical protein
LVVLALFERSICYWLAWNAGGSATSAWIPACAGTAGMSQRLTQTKQKKNPLTGSGLNLFLGGE